MRCLAEQLVTHLLVLSVWQQAVLHSSTEFLGGQEEGVDRQVWGQGGTCKVPWLRWG